MSAMSSLENEKEDAEQQRPSVEDARDRAVACREKRIKQQVDHLIAEAKECKLQTVGLRQLLGKVFFEIEHGPILICAFFLYRFLAL
jgi:hypothetical protein